MIAKSIAPLIAAATGKPVKAEEPTASPMGEAFSQRLMPASGDYASFSQSMGLPGQVGYSSAGLSPKGKYSGFNTGSDLETAITGQAYSQNEAANAWAQNLKSLAEQRVGRMDEDRKSLNISSVNRLGGVFSRDLAKQQLPVEILQYRREMLDEAQPIVQQEYQKALRTSEQVEETPMSQYARAIATKQYGMNPALAAGTFGTDFDVQAYEDLRNEQAMGETGMPYDAYRTALEDQYKTEQRALAAETATSKAKSAEVSKALGINADRLATASNMTAPQLYETIGRTYNYDGQEVTFNDQASAALQLMAEGKQTEALANAQILLSNPETNPLGMALLGYVNMLNQMMNLGGGRALGAEAYMQLPGFSAE